MIEKPRLKTFLTVFPISENTWGLRGGHEELWRVKLKDERAVRALGSLLPYLDGRHRTDDILRRISEQGIVPKIARSVLDYLERTALIEEAGSSDLTAEEEEHFRDQIAFFSRFTSGGGARHQSLLRRTRIGLIGDGGLGRSVLRGLGEAGFGEVVVLGGAASARLDRTPEPADRCGATIRRLVCDRRSIWPGSESEDPPEVFIVAQESHDPELLEAMDAFSREKATPWLLVRLFDRFKGWVGPLFVPDDTASYLSMEARFRSNIPFFEEYLAFDRHVRAEKSPPPPIGGFFAFFDLMSSMAVTEVIKLVTGIHTPQLAGRFLTIDFLSWETEMHEVLRVPRLERGFQFRPRIFSWKEIPYGDAQRAGA